MPEPSTPRIGLHPPLAALLAVLLSCGVATATEAQQQDTGPASEEVSDPSATLSPQQTIRLSVGRWDAVEETFTPWDSLGGEFRIPPGGDLTLPMVGTVSALGQSPEALGREIAQKLRERMGMGGEVEVGVTVTGYAPIYVTGDVKAPGTYDYVPGMTVVQALGQAGGVATPAPRLLSGDRDALNSMGTYKVLQLELLRRLATMARLEAEVTDAEMETPEELAEAPMGKRLVEQEREIMQARESAFESNLSQLDELEDLLNERIARLDRQIELRDEQLSLTQEQLDKATQLVEDGLSTADNQSNLQRQVADQQVRRLELETARLEAEQRLNETRRQRLDLTNSRQRELVEGLQEQRSRIGELRVRMETESALYADSLATGTGILQMEGSGGVDLEVTRSTGGETETLGVTRGDRLQGGDVLDVTLPGVPGGDEVPVHRIEGVGEVELPGEISGDLPEAAVPPRGGSEATGAEAPSDAETSDARSGTETPPS